MPERYYRRRLPHWRADEAIYFITWRLSKGQPELAPAERELVMSALRHFEGKRYHLDAFVVMNDHVHVLIAAMEPYRLEDIVHSWKSFTANQDTARLWPPRTCVAGRVLRSDCS
jgi:REP element-mobilizing transposase RayT